VLAGHDGSVRKVSAGLQNDRRGPPKKRSSTRIARWDDQNLPVLQPVPIAWMMNDASRSRRLARGDARSSPGVARSGSAKSAVSSSRHYTSPHTPPPPGGTGKPYRPRRARFRPLPPARQGPAWKACS
jgi:hypothetical protein